MASDSSLERFLTDLGLRAGADAVLFGIFVGLGTVARLDLFGLSTALLGSRVTFFATAFLLVGLVSGG